jgi:F-type H+-transporting ATPase subunit epsilon
VAEAPLTVSLLTPERVLFEGSAERVIVPLHDGEAGVLPGHAPMVARLGAGLARIFHQGASQRTFVSGGFVQVTDNVVTILTDDARPPEELDRAQALDDLQDLLQVKATGDEAQEKLAGRIQRARARVRVARDTGA